MAGWHHRLNGHGFGQAPGVGVGQRGLLCCGSWGCKELDMTEQPNLTELKLNQVRGDSGLDQTDSSGDKTGQRGV